MTTVCSTAVCGTGGWNGPLPGDPDNSSVLSAVSDFGGVQLTWTLPSTNAHAVAYTQIYRSISDVFETAIPFTAVSATGYFDRSAADVIRPYYYWIQHVSTYGTTLEPIGPAMAVAKPQIDQVLSALAGKVESSFLAESLRARIDVITDLENGLTQINSKVTSDNAVFAQELTALRDTLTDTLAYVDAQQSLSITERQALVTSLNTQLAQFSAGTYAAIQDEATTRAEETGELFAQKTLKIDLAGNVAGYGLSARVDPTGQYDSSFQVRADSFSIAAPSVSHNSAPLNPYNGMVWVDTSVTPSVTRWFNKAAGAWQTTPVKGAEPFVYRATPTTVDGYTIEPGMYVSGAVIDRISARQIDTRGLIIRDLDGSPVIQMGAAIDWSKLGGTSNLQAMGYTGALDATRNVFRGALTYGQAYLVGDTVIADGYGWSCIQAHFSEAANRPPPYPATENAWWTLASVKGADTLNAVLSNEAFVFPAGSDGAVSSYVGSGTAIRVYEGADELAYDGVGTGAGTWKVTTAATNITVGSLTDSGTYLTVGQHSGVASGTDTASITYTITGKTKAGADFTLMKVQTFAKSKTGATGAAGLNGLNFADAKLLYTDPTFQTANNNVAVYNNLVNGNVIITREAKQADSPFADSGFNLKISNIGTSSPGLGGFYQNINARASAVFVQRIVAKVPVGYTLTDASNAIGDGGTHEWLTSRAGTGKFQEYLLLRRCGPTGSFSNSGHIYMAGPANGTPAAPVNWYLAYATVYDFTAVGFGAITAVLSNETHTVPTDSAGNNGNFTGCATTVTIYNGTTDDSANWTVAATPAAGVTGSLAGKTYTVTAMTVDTGYVDLVASRSGYASVTKRFTLAKSKAGATGATGATGAQGPSVLVTPDRVTTFTATDGTLDASQADIVFTAAVSGVASPTYVWSFSGFQTAPTNSGAATQTITAAQFGTAKSAIVTCTVNGTYTDKVTIVRLEKSTAAAGATVGAPTGTYVGGVLAETVAGKADGALQKAGDAITGPVTFATNGGILAATDADNGVFMGPNGLVGKKAGATTFAIDTAGNASFGGELNAATGTFSGSLSAATGTFSGELTATAINAVDTINIKGNAITIPVGASGSSGSVNNGSSVQIISAGITVSGGEGVFISVQARTKLTATFQQTANPWVASTVGLYCNGILIDSFTASHSTPYSGTTSLTIPGIFTRMDYPGNGTHTYYVVVSRSGSVANVSVTYDPPHMFLFLAKR